MSGMSNMDDVLIIDCCALVTDYPSLSARFTLCFMSLLPGSPFDSESSLNVHEAYLKVLSLGEPLSMRFYAYFEDL